MVKITAFDGFAEGKRHGSLPPLHTTHAADVEAPDAPPALARSPVYGSSREISRLDIEFSAETSRRIVELTSFLDGVGGMPDLRCARPPFRRVSRRETPRVHRRNPMASKPPAWAGINLACWSISTLQVCRVLVMVVSPWAPAERSDARLARSRVRRGSPAGWTTATSHRRWR